jgi:hypothetical protein
MRLDPHYPGIVLHYVAQANFSLGNYGTAAKQLLERISRTPGTDSSRMMLAGASKTRARRGPSCSRSTRVSRSTSARASCRTKSPTRTRDIRYRCSDG